MRLGVVVLLAGVACGEPDPVDLSTGTTDTGPTTTVADPQCEPVSVQSACDNQASLIAGSVTLPADYDGPTTGDLLLGLMHRAIGSADDGGHPHWAWTVADVDLSAPVPFVVDMCDGNAIMWSEENCEYNLLAILDVDRDAGAFDLVPSEADPAARVTLSLSCRAEGPLCLGEVPLDCVGPGCVRDRGAGKGGCECAAESCGSESAICLL